MVEIFPNGDPGTAPRNVKVTVSVDGGKKFSAPFLLRVLRPYRAIAVAPPHDSPEASYGYQTTLHYAVLDQSGDVLPQPIYGIEADHPVIDEIRDYFSTDWLSGFEDVKGEADPADVTFTIHGEFTDKQIHPRPKPVAPCEPKRCLTKILHWCASDRVDYLTVGDVVVASYVFEEFQDHGRACDFVSPARIDDREKRELLPACPARGKTSCPRN